SEAPERVLNWRGEADAPSVSTRASSSAAGLCARPEADACDRCCSSERDRRLHIVAAALAATQPHCFALLALEPRFCPRMPSADKRSGNFATCRIVALAPVRA